MSPEADDMTSASADGRLAAFGLDLTFVFELDPAEYHTNVVMSVLAAMREFVPFYVITQGGPANSTETINILLFNQAFSYFNMGYASSMAVAISPDSGLKYTSYFADILGDEGLPKT